MNPRIFISYRREDSAGHAGRLYDRLATHFGAGNVFMDVDTLDPGVDFVDVVDESVRSCDALVAVIGREWLGSDPQSGQRRIDNDRDFVRLEIEAALARGVLVVPALVQDARMPGPGDLPSSLAPLARRNGIWLSHERWDYDVGRLITAIEDAVARARTEVDSDAPEEALTETSAPVQAENERTPRRIWIGAAAALLVAAAIAAVVLTRDGDGMRTGSPVPTSTSGADADLSVKVSQTRRGFEVDYRVTVHNAGPDDAASVTMRAILTGPSFQIRNVRTTGDGTCELEKSSAPNEIACTYRSIPGTGDAVLSFFVTVRSAGTLDVTATTSSRTPDHSVDDNHDDSSDEVFDEGP